MKVTYKKKTSEVVITLSYTDTRQFLSTTVAVDAVRNLVDQAVKKFSSQPERRKKGEHLFADYCGVPKCVTCWRDEDDAFVGGEPCSFGNNS